MKGWVLNVEESDCARWIIKNLFTYKKLDCWDMKIPEWFENHTPCDDSKDW